MFLLSISNFSALRKDGRAGPLVAAKRGPQFTGGQDRQGGQSRRGQRDFGKKLRKIRPALIFQYFHFLNRDCSQLKPHFDDSMGANESARQAGSNNTMPDS